MASDETEEFEFRARAEAEAGRKRTPIQMIGRQVGLTARAVLEGNPISTVGGMVGKAVGLDTSGALSRTLTRAGLPEPETATERVVQAGAQGMAGGAGMMKLAELGGPAMKAMTKNPVAQIAGGRGSVVCVRNDGGVGRGAGRADSSRIGDFGRAWNVR